MGGQNKDLQLSGASPASVMLVGLQGSGKTTTAGKLAFFLRKKGKKPYLVPADVYRPAAIDQLKKLGEQISVPVFQSDTDELCRIKKAVKPSDILLVADAMTGQDAVNIAQSFDINNRQTNKISWLR